MFFLIVPKIEKLNIEYLALIYNSERYLADNLSNDNYKTYSKKD